MLQGISNYFIAHIGVGDEWMTNTQIRRIHICLQTELVPLQHGSDGEFLVGRANSHARDSSMTRALFLGGHSSAPNFYQVFITSPPARPDNQVTKLKRNVALALTIL